MAAGTVPSKPQDIAAGRTNPQADGEAAPFAEIVSAVVVGGGVVAETDAAGRYSSICRAGRICRIAGRRILRLTESSAPKPFINKSSMPSLVELFSDRVSSRLLPGVLSFSPIRRVIPPAERGRA
jgi:hypothetical protein